MDPISSPTSEARRDQMFPVLSEAELARLRRFGNVQSYAPGASVLRAGDVAPGLQVVLSGKVLVTPHEADLRSRPIVTHGPGEFIGELAQLSGVPALVDATATAEVSALVIPSPRLRDLMVEEAELGERIMRALILRRVGLLEQGVGGPIIVGQETDRDVLRLEGFLARNGHPHRRLDPDSDTCARTLLERFALTRIDLPIVLCPNGQLLRNPSENQLARCIGLVRAYDARNIYDVAIVGAGPAGLAAAVYAASEGLKVIVLDCRAFGGQAGASARIENYMGFPTGISGLALMARAHIQAQKFGAEMAIPERVLSLSECAASNGSCFSLGLADGGNITARSVVIASGAQYRRLGVANLAQFEGSSVHYWASPLEGRLSAGQEVALVGAGNSAGQAAVYLSSQAAKVWLLVRGGGLDATMSRYLCDRVAAQSNIEVLLETEIAELQGERDALETILWGHRSTDAAVRRSIRHLFLFIGAEPSTSWLSKYDIAVDAKGFVRADAFAGDGRLPFETSRRGIFAIGDVRAGSTKRVAAAVGEGAQLVATLHMYLTQAVDRLRIMIGPALEVAHG